VSLGLWISGTTGYSPFVLSSLLQVITGLTHARTSNAIHDHLSRKSKMVNKYAALLSLVESESFASPALQQLQQQLCTGNTRSTDSLRQLKKIVDALDVRQNIVMASVLNTVLLWDIQVIRRTETWRAKYKAAFDQWIEVLAEFDAFISLAGHARIYPNHVFPVLESGTRNIDAVQLGHPLIPANKVVANDYTLQGKPAIDLLTGANMAGKSTFLRTIGVNLVLAMAGAPVCAKSFTFSPILLFTSLRTNDSLQENESFFYAELKRLQQLILLYEQGDTVFFLLDEILKGTNSKDQHEGSRALIQKLLTLKGKGIVATHDVELSVLEEEYPVSIRNICFEITIREDKLNFDYTLRKGVCRTMNASFLMKKMRITD
jgi:DNA mismatch repair ATPase MutS